MDELRIMNRFFKVLSNMPMEAAMRIMTWLQGALDQHFNRAKQQPLFPEREQVKG